MKLFKFTAQPFLEGSRKVSTHFIASEWARAGHDVHIATVGLSRLSRLKDKALLDQLAVRQWNRFHEVKPGLSVSAYIPPVHPFSSRKRVLNLLMGPVFRLYGNHIPRYLRTELAGADAVFFEPGTCLAFVPSVRKLNPAARLVYIKRDWLTTIGAGPYLQALEQEIYSDLDMVITPSSQIASVTSEHCRTEILPQAIDKSALDIDPPSPFAAGTRNAISIGNMLFDEDAVRSMAQADLSVTYHVFGARFKGDKPQNVVEHGERPFADLVPFLRHADFGVAPYAMRPEDIYLAETSLKFLQYAYCRLPVLAPDLIPDRRGNIVGYSLKGEADWPGRVAAALHMERKSKFRDGIMTWKEVAERIAGLVAPVRPSPRVCGDLGFESRYR